MKPGIKKVVVPIAATAAAFGMGAYVGHSDFSTPPHIQKTVPVWVNGPGPSRLVDEPATMWYRCLSEMQQWGVSTDVCEGFQGS